MNTQQIKNVIDNHALPDSCLHADYVETTNAWVIRSDKHVFKIRKPVQANGTDLYNLEERRQVSNMEVKLNKQLAKHVYEGIVALQYSGSGNCRAEVIDYAVKMKRLNESAKLSEQLINKDINITDVNKLANKIAAFHRQTNVIKSSVNTTALQYFYEEINRCIPFAYELFGQWAVQAISKSVELSRKFLHVNRLIFQQRSLNGLIRNGHGNLTADKIFIEDGSHVITDRVVFNDSQRNADVLFDIALLGTDFDFHRYYQLDKAFVKYYHQHFGSEYSLKIQLLYIYYKMYRTGQLITKKLDRVTIYNISPTHKHELTRYIKLLIGYMKQLS